MTVTISEVRARVAARFPDVEQVSESTIRFTRKAGESPFAVYYLALAQDLPSTQEMLTKYQDQVIGERYFEGRKSLQWSTYLYFVTSRDRLASNEVQLAKDLIEHDRSYARKFIISEEEIDSVLTPTVVTPTAGTPNASILSVWTDRLVEAGLDKAILSDDDLPSRLRLIEASTGPGPHRSARKRTTKVKSATFLRSLELTKFRPFPSQRVFAFGTVNLIFGPNGSGKTSLLEAIELFIAAGTSEIPVRLSRTN
jgi:hypothetical protein